MSYIKTNTERGFTIVELLIVIVVIAILAAITIVSYNGIQARAKLVQQTAELDKIGKAIQLWSADEGTSLASSGAGASGKGVGMFTGKNASSYTATSIEDLLRSSKHLTGEINPNAFDKGSVLLTSCANESDTRWVVMAIVSPAPPKTAAEQISATGCTNPMITVYAGGSYNRNLIKAY